MGRSLCLGGGVIVAFNTGNSGDGPSSLRLRLGQDNGRG
jgi:hypothetical protein